MLAVWDDLAGNEVRQFPAKVSGPREGLGPIGAPDSGDDVSLWGGPSPHAQSPIKVGAVPPPLSFSFFFRSGLALVDIAMTRLLLPGLRLLVSAHTTSTPPAYHPANAPWTPPLLHSSLPSRTRSPHALLKPETMRQLPHYGAPLPKCIGGASCYLAQRYQEHSLNSFPFSFQYSLFIGFPVYVCVCPGACLLK